MDMDTCLDMDMDMDTDMDIDTDDCGISEKIRLCFPRSWRYRVLIS
jgi:hypothetical protein